MGKAVTNSQRLKSSEQARKDSPTGERKVNGPVLPCQSKNHKTYYHLGSGIGFGQYAIGSRSTGFEMPVLANAGATNMEPLHAATGSDFVVADAAEQPRSAKKLYAPGTYPDTGQVFSAEATMGDCRLTVESNQSGYQLDATSNAQLNASLGKTLALHLSRSGIFLPGGTGTFEASYLGAQETGLQLTEMMGVKLFVYVNLELNGIVAIREIIDGRLEDVPMDSKYEQRKLLNDRSLWYSDSMCGSMPMIPGLYQVHMLLESGGGGSFALTEVYCDGDRIFPE